MTSSNLNCLPNISFPNTIALGGRASAHELVGGGSSIQSLTGLLSHMYYQVLNTCFLESKIQALFLVEYLLCVTEFCHLKK